MALVVVESGLEFLRREPVRLVAVVQTVGDFAAIFRVVLVAQLQRVGNQHGLLIAVQAGDFAFELLKTHGTSLTVNRFYASARFFGGKAAEELKKFLG